MVSYENKWPSLNYKNDEITSILHIVSQFYNDFNKKYGAPYIPEMLYNIPRQYDIYHKICSGELQILTDNQYQTLQTEINKILRIRPSFSVLRDACGNYITGSYIAKLNMTLFCCIIRYRLQYSKYMVIMPHFSPEVNCRDEVITRIKNLQDIIKLYEKITCDPDTLEKKQTSISNSKKWIHELESMITPA